MRKGHLKPGFVVVSKTITAVDTFLALYTFIVDHGS